MKNYRRELDLDTGIATTTYDLGDVTYIREVLASAPHNVIAAQLTSSKAGSINVAISLTRERDAQCTIDPANPGTLILQGQIPVQYFNNKAESRDVPDPAKASGAASANRARSSISRFYKWAIGEGLCESNPVRDTNKREDENKSRDRVLSDSEIAAVWLNAPDSDYGNILKLILLTGCRREEIGGLKWSEIDLEARTITLPSDRTKNGLDFVIPLSATALAILTSTERRGDHVFGRRSNGFSGWSRAKRELDEVVKIESWTVHDLRRTVATKLAESPVSIQPHIVEAVLNHVSGAKDGVAGIYNRAQYQPEKKDALDRWAHHLKTVIAQATGANVTPIKAARRE